ncbi:Valyl-tRNA synthetase [Candidatus Phaeomarinobacter ectocarpi]|uniref:Valine--tRNA ligase n=1 Tax=Candidatus Phaeomarinibacter ectocarpi TaxID=1458461 RepID=X5MHK4_9HYPH|nr:valine--tRNA ligase [Candidatus Phaeomarinobacter ectocarpi]CDO61239.1 Valyl-tRNA synthetase [Candidatus Phaeomarinobacter ectocarpi]
MLEKSFQPQTAEPRIYAEWEETGAFKGGDPERVAAGATPYSIVIPPPNVTGSLHMGHALNNTLQDILIRFERMRGKDVLWQPGTDHAGIATQAVVERQLAEQGNNSSRREMGRDAFIERVWEWKAESGSTITNQLRRLGASCDWSRERFTMDDGMSKAVLKVFVQLYKEGLIYKDKRLVNWDPTLETAISDLEVVPTDVNGHLWHFRYPLADGKTYEFPTEHDDDGNPIAHETRDYIVVATTRPETMLGDTGVAVNAEDERYKHLIGSHVVLPITGRRIPIVADEHADPTQGSGAVKITPAHDFNDFEVGRRNDLRMINILDTRGKLLLDSNEAFLEGAPQAHEAVTAYHGKDRFDVRKEIVSALDELGMLDKIDDHRHAIPYGDRSNDVIEPFLTDQWYVDAATLAKPAIEAVEKGETTFVPKNWEKTYFEWMRNIQPWCISRQLWWGHRIPAWYGPDKEVFVAQTEEDAYEQAEIHYGKRVDLERDEDVLDTWFSSGLWPFSTQGWPEETPELGRYYGTDVLVTAFDIIFFWVARMMMFGLHFMKEVPFKDVYIHALVRDDKGAKMSKSKGNVIDPLELIDTYGADALRFTLTAMAAQGRDIKLSTSRVEGYRNFGTKLWNAARFCQMNECSRVKGFDVSTVTSTPNKWIAGETRRTAAKVTEALEGYRFNEAAGALYHFVWDVYCDWYVELIKPVLYGTDEATKAETRATAAWALDQILLMLHPMMPFLTEELWKDGVEGPARTSMLVSAEWPTYSAELGDAAADAEIDWIIRLVSEVRSVRAQMNVPAGAKIPLVLRGASAETIDRIARNKDMIERLARLDSIKASDETPAGAIQSVVDEATLFLPLADVIDIDAERARLAKEIGKIDGEIKKIDGKLGNEKFLSKAPEAVIEEQRERRTDAEQTRAKLADALGRLEGAA